MRTILYIACLILVGCSEKKLDEQDARFVGIEDCKTLPAFVKNTPLDPNKIAFSTTVEKERGLFLIEQGTFKKWQHPTWKEFGYFGSITTTETGRIFLAPTPQINSLYEPTQGYNTVFSVDPSTGVLAPFIQLSSKLPKTEQPFGLLGVFYDCSTKLVYATSIYGSSRNKEKGVIYAIDITSNQVIDKLENIDAFGCCVLGVTGEKRLYFGSARTSDMLSVELSENGKFIGEARKEFSLQGLGPRGDDKAKKIRFVDGLMQVTGFEFMHNLVAPTQVQQTKYNFKYNRRNKVWEKR